MTAGVAICRAIEALREYKRTQEKSDKIRANSASEAIDAPMDHGLVRDSVRQEANLTMEQEGLTTDQNSTEPEVVKLTSQLDTFKWSQPTLDQVLSRWYKLRDVTWSYANVQDYAVTSMDVSKELFNIATLFDRIKRFRYWRGGIKVKIQVNSTPFHYGSLVAAIIPYYTANEVSSGWTIDSSVWSLSGQACFGILSANTGKALELNCPFQCPNEYLDITQQTDMSPFVLKVGVMNPLKVAGGATNPTLSVSIFAQFTDLEIMGPSEITANSSSKKISPADKEQRNATKQGTLGKVAGAVANVASKLTAVPVIGGIASAVAPVASAVGGILDFFGWDKPTNMSSQVFTIERPGRGLQHGSGQDPSESLGLKPDQKLSTEGKHFGYDDPAAKSFLKLLQTPMWNASFTIANNQSVGQVFKRLCVRPYAPDYVAVVPTETQRHDYLSFYSQFFKGCRGGYRYYIHFDTSSYTTARVRVTFEPSASSVTSITDGGDSFSRIIDVNGATSVVLEVPYCYPSARMPISYTTLNDSACNGQLLFSLVNPIQTNGSSADVIFVNLFRCAADDFRFYAPHVYTTTKNYVPPAPIVPPTITSAATNNTRILANSLAELFGSQTVCTLGDGPKVIMSRITEDEEIETHNDFLHRYHPAQDTSGALTSLYPTAGDAYYWMSCFRSYRGAVRIHMAFHNNLDGIVIDSANQSDMISSGAYLHEAEAPIEVPYNNNIRFLPLRQVETIYLDAYMRKVRTTTAEVEQTMWAAGDDFTMGLRRSPMPVILTIP